MFLKPSAFTQDVKPLLKQSCSAVFGSATGLTDMLVKHLPLSKAGTATKVRTKAQRISALAQHCRHRKSYRCAFRIRSYC